LASAESPSSEAACLSVTNPVIEATNNESVRSLRLAAVYRKITNGFRSEWGATLCADIRTVVETGRRRAIDAIHT
jgi:hypothetical protein